jgi:hypothetical protein
MQMEACNGMQSSSFQNLSIILLLYIHFTGGYTFRMKSWDFPHLPKKTLLMHVLRPNNKLHENLFSQAF